MTDGDLVILIENPWKHGTGILKGLTKHGWLWVKWSDGRFDSHPPHALELAETWEDRTLRTAA